MAKSWITIQPRRWRYAVYIQHKLTHCNHLSDFLKTQTTNKNGEIIRKKKPNGFCYQSVSYPGSVHFSIPSPAPFAHWTTWWRTYTDRWKLFIRVVSNLNAVSNPIFVLSRLFEFGELVNIERKSHYMHYIPIVLLHYRIDSLQTPTRFLWFLQLLFQRMTAVISYKNKPVYSALGRYPLKIYARTEKRVK